MKREELKAEALIDLGSEPAPKEWENIPCIKEQRPPIVGFEASLQRFTGTDICTWFICVGGLWQPHSDYFQVSLPPAEGAEQRIRVRNILQDFYRRGEYELEQAEEDIMRLFQPQPTAEGAEEILESILESLGDPINIHNHAFEIRPYTVDHTTEWWIFHNGVGSGEPLTQWLSKFATLHAQKIADKMVEWISVKDKLPTQEDADEYGKVLIYRETNSDQMGMSKTIYDYAMVKYCDEQTYWMKLPDKP